MVPGKDIRTLRVKWPMLPEMVSAWRSKPLHYLSHVIGHEGPNSLLSELISQGLVTGLSAGASDRLMR